MGWNCVDRVMKGLSLKMEARDEQYRVAFLEDRRVSVTSDLLGLF
jgi:hypothetical protein